MTLVPGAALLWLGNLQNVRTLEIYDWAGEELPKRWDSERTIDTLYFNTRTGKIPPSLRSLSALTHLGIDVARRNVALELPDWLDELKNLKKILLRNVRLKSVPYSLIKTGLPFCMSGDGEIGVFLNGATLEDGDISLFSQPRGEIEAYYHGKIMKTVREGKIIFLGDGGVGKTSLINRIVSDCFDPDSRSTDGVEMKRWETVVDGIPFTLRILDFGGQEILHSMHRCFLTEHTVYVIVCDSRDDSDIDNAAARWMETVKSFAPDCPIILALNKEDLNPHVTVNERDLRKRNPMLRTVLKTSAKSPKDSKCGTSQLIQAINKEIPGCIGGYEVGEDFLGVKRALENMMEGAENPKNYISVDEYRDICVKNHISDTAGQNDLLERLKDLGIVYSYQNREGELDVTLENLRVLNPKWLTNGIYRLILRTPDSGFLSHKVIQETLLSVYDGDVSDTKYTPQETEFILHVMREFEISMYMGNGVEMIPLKLPKTPPKSVSVDDFIHEDALHIQWKGEYFPGNLIHRLMIKMSQDLDKKRAWRFGGCFYNNFQKCDALVEMNGEALDVYVTEANKQLYMAEFRTKIDQLLKELNLQAEEMICVSRHGQEARISYTTVMDQFILRRKQEIYIPELGMYFLPEWLLQIPYPHYENDSVEYKRNRKDMLGNSQTRESEKRRRKWLSESLSLVFSDLRRVVRAWKFWDFIDAFHLIAAFIVLVTLALLATWRLIIGDNSVSLIEWLLKLFEVIL